MGDQTEEKTRGLGLQSWLARSWQEPGGPENDCGRRHTELGQEVSGGRGAGVPQAPRLLGSLVPATVGYAATGLETRIHRGLPSPYLTFIFSLDGPVVTGETPAQAYGPDAQRHDVLVGGLVSRPAYVVQPATQAGVQLAVHPLAARALFGMPARELGVLAADGRDVLGPRGGASRGAAASAGDLGGPLRAGAALSAQPGRERAASAVPGRGGRGVDLDGAVPRHRVDGRAGPARPPERAAAAIAVRAGGRHRARSRSAG